MTPPSPTVLVIALAIVAPVFPSQASAQESQSDRFTAVARTLVDEINGGDYDAIVRHFSAQMLAGFPPDRAKAYFKDMVAKMGKIVKIEPPRLMPPEQALFLIHFERGEVRDLKLILDQQNKFLGLGFLMVEQKPPDSDHKEARKNQTPLRLPFNGRWLVESGGDTRELNAHHDSPNQVFAFDFVGVGPDGKTSSGDGKRREDYYAFGREVLASADGVVTDVIEGVRDNPIDSLNPYSALGNAVFIQHPGGEVSVLAHLKLGSTRVKPSDTVKAGQVVGLCGNSGNSRKPHLHYHLQDTPVIQAGTGIKVYFQKLVVTGDGKSESKEHYSPTRGDIVSP